MAINVQKLMNLDRRWLFVAMTFAIVLPLIFPFALPLKVGPRVQKLYDTVEALPAGAVVLIAADYDPGSAPELYPFHLAVLRHLFRKNVKVVSMSLWPAASPLIDQATAEVTKDLPKKEYDDYVNLGFKQGQILVMREVAEDIRRSYPVDARQKPVAQIPIMSNIRSIKDFALMISISAGYPGLKEWVQNVQSRTNVRMVGASTAVGEPDYIPYYQSGQVLGISGGMSGSAQYERLVGLAGDATRGMDAQSLAHLFIIFSIVFGNVLYFLDRRRRQLASGGNA